MNVKTLKERKAKSQWLPSEEAVNVAASDNALRGTGGLVRI